MAAAIYDESPFKVAKRSFAVKYQVPKLSLGTSFKGRAEESMIYLELLDSFANDYIQGISLVDGFKNH
jgi:hypothetical protein